MQGPAPGSGLRASCLCLSVSPGFLRSLFLGGAGLPSLPVSVSEGRVLSLLAGAIFLSHMRGGGGGGVRKQNETVYSESFSLSNNLRRKQNNSSPFFSFGHLSLFFNRV